MRNSKKTVKNSNTKLISLSLVIIATVTAITYFLQTSNTPLNKCNSTNQVNVKDKESVSIACGDTVVLEANFKGSTGYEPFTPIFDNTVFELTKYTDSEKGNGMPGGDGIIRTYIFKSLQKSPGSRVEIGIHRPWEPVNLKQIQKTVTITVR
jgi:hypothetical protein